MILLSTWIRLLNLSFPLNEFTYHENFLQQVAVKYSSFCEGTNFPFRYHITLLSPKARDNSSIKENWKLLAYLMAVATTSSISRQAKWTFFIFKITLNTSFCCAFRNVTPSVVRVDAAWVKCVRLPGDKMYWVAATTSSFDSSETKWTFFHLYLFMSFL